MIFMKNMNADTAFRVQCNLIIQKMLIKLSYTVSCSLFLVMNKEQETVRLSLLSFMFCMQNVLMKTGSLNLQPSTGLVCCQRFFHSASVHDRRTL